MRLAGIVRLTDLMSGPLKLAGGNLGRFTRAVKMANIGVKALAAGLIVAGASAGLTLGLWKGAEAAGGFATDVQRLALISQASAQDLAALRKEALRLGVVTEWSPREAAAGMTAMASAGYKTAEILRGVRPILDFTTAGIGDMATAVKITDSVLKAWGLGMDQASWATDRLTRLTQLASIEMGELATSVPVVAAAGAAANQSLSSTLAVLGAIRPAAQSTQDAAQIFNSFAEALKAPSIRISNWAEKVHGIDLTKVFRGADGQIRPMVDIIDQLQRATAKMSLAERDLFLKRVLNSTGAKAYNAILRNTYRTVKDGREVTLTGTAAVRAMQLELDKAGGTTGKFAKKMKETWDGVKKMLGGTLETFAIVLGAGPLEVFSNLLTWITNLLNPVLEWTQRHERLVKVLGGSITTIVLVAGAAGLLAAGLGLAALMASKAWVGLTMLPGMLKAVGAGFMAASRGFWALTVAFFKSPLGWVILVIIGIIVAVVLMYRKWQAFRDFVDAFGARLASLWRGIGEGFKIAWDFIVKAMGPVIDVFRRLISWVGKADTKGQTATVWFAKWIQLGRGLGIIVAGAIALILWPITAVIAGVMLAVGVIRNLGAITDWFAALWARLTTDMSRMWSLALDDIKALWGGVTAWLSGLWDSVMAWMARQWGALTGAIGQLWDSALAGIKSLWQGAWSWIGSIDLTGFISAAIDRIIAFVKTRLLTLAPVQWINEKFLALTGIDLTAHITAALDRFSNWIKTKLAALNPVQAIKEAFSGLENIDFVEYGRKLIIALGEGIKANAKWLYNQVLEALGPIGRLIPGSDAKEGPLSRLTAGGAAIPTTMAAGLKMTAPTLRTAAVSAMTGADMTPLIERAKVQPLGESGQVDLSGLIAALAAGRNQGDASAEAASTAPVIHIANLTLRADDLQGAKDLADMILAHAAEGVDDAF